MSELRELYQEVIIDHSKRPRNQRAIDHARHADGHNPLCGDRITVYVDVDGDIIRDVAFQGSGCAISTAAASLMSEALKGRSIEQAQRMFQRYHDLVTGKLDDPLSAMEELDKLAVFAGVRDFPGRVKCATPAWHTLRAALDERAEPVTVTTE